MSSTRRKVMARTPFGKPVLLMVLLGFALPIADPTPSSAVLGVRRRTAVVAYSAGAAKSEAAAQQSAAAQQAAAQQSAAAQAAAAQSAADSAQASAAAAEASAQQKSPQQQLQELQSLYEQKLISASEYAAAKQKILDKMTH
jgi:type IV secretory pathway TrbL component